MRLALLALLLLVAGACVSLRGRPLLLAAMRYREAPNRLLLPVKGVSSESLRSSWHAPRSKGRLHEGVDIFSDRGTPVVSTAAGEIYKIGRSGRGGNSVTVLGPGPALYYYAHLKEHAPHLRIQERIQAGQLLGWVGNSGNAKATPPHLHFGIYPIHWGSIGAPVDPAPILQKIGVPLEQKTKTNEGSALPII